MIFALFYKPTMGKTALSPLASEHGAALTFPSCTDCQLPAVFRIEAMDARLDRPVKVHQCPNCAKIIWGGE